MPEANESEQSQETLEGQEEALENEAGEATESEESGEQQTEGDGEAAEVNGTEDGAGTDQQTAKPFDKVRQQLQQELGNYRRQLEPQLQALSEQVGELRQQIASQGGRITAGQKQQVAELEGDLDQMLKSAGQDDYQALVKAVNVLAGRLKNVDQLVEERVAPIRQQSQAMQARQHRAEFEATHPDLRAKYDDLVGVFQQRFAQVPAAERNATVANLMWTQVVGEAASGVPKPPAGAKAANTRTSAGAITKTPEAGRGAKADPKARLKLLGEALNASGTGE